MAIDIPSSNGLAPSGIADSLIRHAPPRVDETWEDCHMKTYSAETRPSKKASPNWFSGTVWQNPIIEAPAPARVHALKVAFEPGARTAWHSHPLGQTLHVLSGVGLVQLRGQAAQQITAGDTVWIDPGEEHWHGAMPTHAMTHIAIQERLDGTMADWLNKLTDEEYEQSVATLQATRHARSQHSSHTAN